VFFLAFLAKSEKKTDGEDSLSMSMDYDVLIIGGGAAGKDAAFLAARAGLEPLLIEKE
jgi:glycerol-3-phosphate dehydrogenase